ncbi:hypothetical protein EDC02_3146 [Micromonospora sp. Llam0]|uniref:hypothetical protein n=1 Tax=Micromonospora sp. Llam0 TaxID=2485143 RepID=UPI000F9FDDC1|nr:hypothetical protein [Micromonospora sp. Llam0]ROO61214.1 hypothetical protein EDC02_3146 [Micromonospora sp. Llam0]
MSCYPSVVESGAFVSPDPNAEVPGWVRDAPRIPGIVRVYFDHDALGSLSLTDTLLSNLATLDRWVDSPSDDEVRVITRAAAEERTGKHHLDLDLPGRTDLLDPSDDRVLPIDDRHRIVPVDRATGVRIVPEVHLLDRDPGVRDPSVLPFEGQFPGQLRVQGEMVRLGLPAGLVNERHSVVSAIPAPAAPTRTAGGYPELLGHLNSLPVGSRTIVQVISGDGVDTYTALAISGPKGPAVLQETAGKIGAAPFPRRFAAIRHAPLPSVAEPARPPRPAMVLRAGVDSEIVAGLLAGLRAVAVEYGARVRDALAPHASESAYADAMAGWNSFMTSLLSYDGSTFDRSAHPEQVFGAYESVHNRLAGLDKIAAHPLPPIEDTLPPAYFVPVRDADVNQSVNVATLDWATGEHAVSVHDLRRRQGELLAGRQELLQFLSNIMETATRVFDDSTSRRQRSGDSQGKIDSFQRAVDAYWILASGRLGYANLETDQQKEFFNSNYRDYLPIYRELGRQFRTLADHARKNPKRIAGDRDRDRTDRDRINRHLPDMRRFVKRLPDAEAKLRRARTNIVRIVASEQSGFVAQNTRDRYETQNRRATFRYESRIDDEDVCASLNDPDPVTGKRYSDGQKLKIDDARQALLARHYEEWACGTLAADARVRLNQLLSPAGRAGSGDQLSLIDYGVSEHGASTFDHYGVHVGPTLQPESVIYDPWTRQTTITTAEDLTVPAVHRYGQIDAYFADGYDWTQVAERYIDWDRMRELDENPPERQAVAPEDVSDVDYGSLEYARNNDSAADRMELSAYGMSATAASEWQPNPDLFHESSEGWAQDHPPSGLGRTDVAEGEFQYEDYEDYDDQEYPYQQGEFGGGYYGSNAGPSTYPVKVNASAGFRPSLPGSVGELTSRYDDLRASLDRAGPVLADVLDRTGTRPHWDTLVSATDRVEVDRQLGDLGFAATQQAFGDHWLLLDQIIDRLDPAVTLDDVPAAAALQELRGRLGAPLGRIDSVRYHEMHTAVVRHLPGGSEWTGQPGPDGVPSPILSPVYGPLAASVRELRIDGRPLVSTDEAANPIVLLDTRQEPVFASNYSADEAPVLVDRILDRHYAAMAAATEPFERLRAISETVVALHIGHFHTDGNARVNVDLLLHRLMIDAGFDPVIFPDMSRSFNGHRDVDSLAQSLANRQGRPLAEHLGIHDGHLTDAEMPPPPPHDDPLARPMSERAPAEPAAVSLTDFLTGGAPAFDASVRPGAYEVFAAGLHRPDPAVPNFYSPAGADPARVGSLGRDVAELIDAGLAQALAATPDVPALHLPVTEHGGRATEADVRGLNHTLELFAQAGVLPVVATRGAIDPDTAQMLDRYGAAAWHAASGGGADSGGGFRLRRPGSRGRTGQPGATYVGIDARAHHSAVAQARPTVVDKAPEPVLEVLLEENPQRQRELMNDRPELVTSDDFLDRVTGMGERVPNVPAVRLLRPDVRLRRLGLPDTVHGYVATPAMDRPNILLETVGQLHERGEDTAVLAELVDAETAHVTDGTAGEVQNRDFLVDLLEALDQAKAGEFTGARTTDGEFAGVEAFVDANRHRLTDSDTKYRILEALGTYHQTRSTDAEKAQVQALQFAVSKCL